MVNPFLIHLDILYLRLRIKKHLSYVIVVFFTVQSSFAQQSYTNTDTLQLNVKYENANTLNYKTLIIPSVLVGFGIVGLESHSIKNTNIEIREEITENIDAKFTLDDFSQYIPAASVYTLNAIGIEGKHKFKDRTLILGTAYLIMGSTVTLLKQTGNVIRPDGSSNNSFPSGHTATAFMGAEFLFQEYKDISIWYGISGYIIATGTGFFRMYNNRHWLTDISAGAGIGILSTKIAYLLYPYIKNTFLKNKNDKNLITVPFYNGKQLGIGMIFQF